MRTIDSVCTPTLTWLRAAIAKCRSEFLVSSPFVGSILCSLVSDLRPGIRKTLITVTDLRVLALGGSEIDALCELAELDMAILSLRRLHAKVYVLDRRFALVTSANATTGGLRRNIEFGLAVHDRVLVGSIVRSVLGGFGSRDQLEPWSAQDLKGLRATVELLRARLPAVPRLPDLNVEALPTITLGRKARTALVDGLTGWTALTMEGVLAQPSDEFTLDALAAACARTASERFPRNLHVRPKLRQQLQRLRDLGLVEFLGGGSYRRTVNP